MGLLVFVIDIECKNLLGLKCCARKAQRGNFVLLELRQSSK